MILLLDCPQLFKKTSFLRNPVTKIRGSTKKVMSEMIDIVPVIFFNRHIKADNRL